VIPQEYLEKVKAHFNGDNEKAWRWFQSINPNFGMLSPLNLIKLNRQNKVIDYINKEMNHASQKRK
jgi:hypothetical protein